MNKQAPDERPGPQASARLSRLSSHIMQRWETRAVKEVLTANEQSSLALINSLPELLDEIVEALSTAHRTPSRVKLHRINSQNLSRQHANDRAGSSHYTMDQLIFEYHILRQEICLAMENEAPLSSYEREAITCLIEQAVNDAATEFCKSMRAISSKLAHDEELKASIHSRDEFLTVVSHELKTPLTVLQLQSDMLLRYKDAPHKELHTEKVYNFAGLVNVQVKRISRLVEDILDFGRIRTGGYKPDMHKLNICDIIDQVIDSLDPVFQTFRVGPPEFSCYEKIFVNIDKQGFEKVFKSLFTNAIKYGQGKPVSVQVKIKESEVETIVTDNGIGIAPAHRDRVFKRFERAISPSEVSGLGLGLYIAKEIIVAHGGRIWVDGELGKGSAFHFCLPKLPD